MVFSISLFAQDSARQNLSSPGLIYSFDINDNEVNGTPYIVNEFLPGKISADKDGNIFNLRYNAYNDIIEIQKSANEIEALYKDLVDVTVTILNKSYRAYDYKDTSTNAQKRGYFVVVSNGEAGQKPLLIKERIIFIEKKPAKSSYNQTKPAQYKRKSDQYYTLNDNGSAINLPSNKKDLANAFPKHTKDVLNFIKSNKIKTSKQEDLIKLINYINTL